MKINIRLLLITFVVIVIISLSSTFIYHSTTTTLLKNQHSKALLNSTTDFKYAFQFEVDSFDEELIKFFKNGAKSVKGLKIDFVFQITDNRKIIAKTFVHNDKINRTLTTDSFEDFLKQYPNIIIKFYKPEEGKSYFYGKIITEDFLNNLSEKIRAEIALVVNQVPYITSHSSLNSSYYPLLIDALQKGNSNKRNNIYYKELENEDFFLTIYSPEFIISTGDGIKFLLFSIPTDLVEFRNTMQTIAITIALAGILLSLIFILLFTTKIRKQISLLSDASKKTASGDLSHRVPILSKDELGNLGIVFNNMLDHIQRKEKAEHQYSELITIINETPLLKDLCDSVLEKIILTAEVSFGVFYIVENNNAKPVSTYGISQSILEAHDKGNFYSNVIEKQKKVELFFNENAPIIKTGLIEIKIKYLLVMPLVFNKNVIGVIELASEHIPEETPVDYLTKIKEQLAVGLNSALSYEQLENLVHELKILNDDYQKQNIQISAQNSELMELHQELKKKAEELEEERKKAVELTHVKSQFLANMSHELRTPLNSIIGLTELISDDQSTLPKTKERLKIVLRNGKKLLSMINNILEFSKIESGKFELLKTNFVLSEFMVDIYTAMEPLVAEKGLEFEIDFNSDYDLLINSDKHKLEQILLNLLSNAIKFTEKGKIVIEINIVNNISLLISVVDSGIGISDEDKEIVFDEFKQVDVTKTQKHQGAGLGLAICKKYVQLLGGKINVFTNKDKGSTFTVTLENVILEKFAIDKNFIFSSGKKGTDREKIILIFGSDQESSAKIASFFETRNYKTKICDNIFQIDVKNNYDGIVVNATKQNESIWESIFEIKKKSKAPLKLILLTDDNKYKAYSLNSLDIISNLENKNLFDEVINITSIVEHKIKKILHIGSNGKIIREKVEKIDESIEVTTTREISNIAAINNYDLIITDLGKINLFNEKIEVPVLLYFPETDITKIIGDVHKTFLKLATEYSEFLENNLKKIEVQFSLIKKAKKSVTSPIENIQSNEVEVIGKAHSVKGTGGDFSVLVVDDDKDTLFTVGEILRNIGCEVTFANNGAECLTSLKENKPDLILLDIMMPIMDGFETIKKIRTNNETKDLLVYAITAQAMLDDINIIKNNGFDDLITKPVDASTLSFKIQQAIQKKIKL